MTGIQKSFILYRQMSLDRGPFVEASIWIYTDFICWPKNLYLSLSSNCPGNSTAQSETASVARAAKRTRKKKRSTKPFSSFCYFHCFSCFETSTSSSNSWGTNLKHSLSSSSSLITCCSDYLTVRLSFHSSVSVIEYKARDVNDNWTVWGNTPTSFLLFDLEIQ